MRIAPRRFGVRVIAAVAAIVVATVVSFGWVSGGRQSAVLERMVRDGALVTAHNIAGGSAHFLVLQDFAGLELQILAQAELPEVLEIQALDTEGVVLADVRHPPGQPPRVRGDARRLEVPSAVAPQASVEGRSLVVWQPVEAGKPLGWVRVVSSLANVAALRRTLWSTTLVLGALWVVGGCALLFWLLRPPLAQIRRLAQFAQGLDRSRGAALAVDTGTAELDALVGALNESSRRLALSDRESRREERRLEALFRVLQAQGTTEAELLGLTVDEAVALTGSRLGYLHGVEAPLEGVEIRSRALRTAGSAPPARIVATDGDGVWAQSWRERRPVLHNDCLAQKPAVVPSLEGVPLLRHLSVPVFDGERVVAVAGVGNSDDPYEESDARRLVAFMNDVWQVFKRRRADALLAGVLESIGDGLLVVDREWRIVASNPAFRAVAGLDAAGLVGRDCREVGRAARRPCAAAAGAACPVVEVFRTGVHATLEHRRSGAGAAEVVEEISAYPLRDAAGAVIGAIEIVRDVTGHLRLEQQLRQAQKMEAVGQLAGGIAHDFNNLLSAIMGFAGLIQMRLAGNDSLSQHAEQIIKVAERGATLTHGLLAFSRRQRVDLQPVDLNAAIAGVQKMLSRLIGEDVEVQVDLGVNDLIVTADRGALEQVLMNLATNARDAMPEGGRLTIAATRERLAQQDGDLVPGDYGVISVSDSGTGIPLELQERVFEPFFTTKEVGKGTGLGLAMVYGIVREHGGAVRVASEPGHGTTFLIWLPLAGGGGAAPDGPGASPQPQRGSESILLVEDDPAVRNVTRDILESFGYAVRTAEDGEAGLRIFAEAPGAIDLVLSDVVMPRMRGRELYDRIRQIRPGIKTLFMSGYSAELAGSRGLAAAGMRLVAKPLKPETLLDAIREVLDS